MFALEFICLKANNFNVYSTLWSQTNGCNWYTRNQESWFIVARQLSRWYHIVCRRWRRWRWRLCTYYLSGKLETNSRCQNNWCTLSSFETLAHSQYVIKSQQIITPSTVPRLMRSVRIAPLVRYIKFHSETTVATLFRFEFLSTVYSVCFKCASTRIVTLVLFFFFSVYWCRKNKDCLFSRWNEEKKTIK